MERRPGSCAAGQRLAEGTVEKLSHLLEIRTVLHRDPAEMSPGILQVVRNAFGDVDLELSDLISRFARLVGGFRAGKTLRCDTGSVTADNDECEQFSAFVIAGNNTDIFLCETFFDPGKTATERGVTLVHEMAHSVLGIGHARGVRVSFDCGSPLGLRYEEAKKNAYPYGILANCLEGEGSEAEEVTVTVAPPVQAPGTGKSDSRWSLSATAGGGARGFAATLGSKISLNIGEYAVWNPTIGFNLLYLPSGVADSSQVAAATAELGLRIQKPLRGFYFDVSGGGFTTFDATTGLTGTAGLGVRWKRLELGAEARAVVPGTEFDNTDVLILGRAALRFR
jgi:hypothetical protein